MTGQLDNTMHRRCLRKIWWGHVREDVKSFGLPEKMIGFGTNGERKQRQPGGLHFTWKIVVKFPYLLVFSPV